MAFVIFATEQAAEHQNDWWMRWLCYGGVEGCINSEMNSMMCRFSVVGIVRQEPLPGVLAVTEKEIDASKKATGKPVLWLPGFNAVQEEDCFGVWDAKEREQFQEREVPQKNCLHAPSFPQRSDEGCPLRPDRNNGRPSQALIVSIAITEEDKVTLHIPSPGTDALPGQLSADLYTSGLSCESRKHAQHFHRSINVQTCLSYPSWCCTPSSHSTKTRR
jgi:hypothetical protein